ncbi:MAG: response regulator [Candidatus Pacearchaeota archaeon]
MKKIIIDDSIKPLEKILIIDDDETFRFLLKNMLKDKYEIIESDNFEEAKEIINNIKFYYIITDNNLNDGYKNSGLKLVDIIRKSEKNKYTNILFCSSYISEDINEELKKYNLNICEKIYIFKKMEELSLI